EAAQLHAQAQRSADAHRLAGEEALQGAGAIQPDEVVVENLFKSDLIALPQRIGARNNQHEAVAAEGIGFERAGIDGSGNDAEVSDPLGDQPDNLVTQALLQIDADVRVRGEKGAERFRQKLGQRVGVRQHPDLPGEAATISAEILMQPLGLAQYRTGMLQQGAAGLRWGDTLAATPEQHDAERFLHVADARRSGGEREVGPLGAVGNAAGLDHVAKEAEIGEIEWHGRILPSDSTKLGFK